MINNDEYKERILIKCSNIMYKYPDVFPIVRTIRESGNATLDNPKEDMEFYVKTTIESRIGLSFIVRKNVQAANVFWLDIEQSILEKGIIKNSIIHYTYNYPVKKDRDNWNKMLSNEKLN